MIMNRIKGNSSISGAVQMYVFQIRQRPEDICWKVDRPQNTSTVSELYPVDNITPADFTFFIIKSSTNIVK